MLSLSTIPNEIRTVVVKIGTTLLSGEKPFDGKYLEVIVKDLARLKKERALDILVVSSGAIGCGMNSLGQNRRPRLLPIKQATAAVGQAVLMHYYETLFRTYGDGLKTAQVLLTAADLDNRHTYLNVRNTLQALFELECVIPIVNENDSTATEELTGVGAFGDNDTLAAKIAAKIDADLLIILTDVDGLYDRDPRQAGAKLLEYVPEITEEIEQMAGGTIVETSVGGMRTKLTAAKIANAAGLPVALANGRRPNIISGIIEGTAPTTIFGPAKIVLSHRKRWIAFGRRVLGTLHIDDGACKALLANGKSLLPAGITQVEGEFEVGAAVRVVDARGHEVARGLVNYSSAQLTRIKGVKTGKIESILGKKDFDEAIHRNNLVVL